VRRDRSGSAAIAPATPSNVGSVWTSIVTSSDEWRRAAWAVRRATPFLPSEAQFSPSSLM
jgi:hypothetical protein